MMGGDGIRSTPPLSEELKEYFLLKSLVIGKP